MAQYAIISKTPQLTQRMTRENIDKAMMWLVWQTSSAIQALPSREMAGAVDAFEDAQLFAHARCVPCKVEVAEGYSVSVELV